MKAKEAIPQVKSKVYQEAYKKIRLEESEREVYKIAKRRDVLNKALW